MKPNKPISIFFVAAFILSVAGAFAFAENSPTLNMLQNGIIPNYDNVQNSGAPPPAVPGLNNETVSSAAAVKPPATAITPPKVSTATAVTPPPPPAPHEPNILERMVKDLDNRKMDYAVSGGAGALTGFFLAGCVMGPAVLLGFGLMILFLLFSRNV